MAQYRKRPIVIEARVFPDDGQGQMDIADWVKQRGSSLHLYDGNIERNVETSTAENWRWKRGYIETLEGDLQVNIGDFIIQGVKGEFYPCKPDIFEMTYEKVE